MRIGIYNGSKIESMFNEFISDAEEKGIPVKKINSLKKIDGLDAIIANLHPQVYERMINELNEYLEKNNFKTKIFIWCLTKSEEEISERLGTKNITYLDLENLYPKLNRLINQNETRSN
jgi:hypothetical protein